MEHTHKHTQTHTNRHVRAEAFMRKTYIMGLFLCSSLYWKIRRRQRSSGRFQNRRIESHLGGSGLSHSPFKYSILLTVFHLTMCESLCNTFHLLYNPDNLLPARIFAETRVCLFKSKRVGQFRFVSAMLPHHPHNNTYSRTWPTRFPFTIRLSFPSSYLQKITAWCISFSNY